MLIDLLFNILLRGILRTKITKRLSQWQAFQIALTLFKYKLNRLDIEHS